MALFSTNNQSISNALAQYQQFQERMSRKVETLTSDQPIVGLRVWKVIIEGGLPYLRSVYKDTVWPYRKALERDCLNDMGIHAVKSGVRSGGPSVADPAGVYAGMDVLSLFASYEADIAGEVYLWGKVDEHTEGYLADFAYPKKLFPHADMDPVVAMQLEDEYGVPCEYRPEFIKIKAIPDGTVPLASIGMQQAQLNALYAMQVQNAACLYPQGLLGSSSGGLGLNPFWKSL